MAYTRAVKPNQVLAAVNVFAFDLGAPALASTNRIVTTHSMSRTAMTIANAASADGLPRNVTVTATQAGGSDDTAATVTVTGTNVSGAVITEDIVPTNGSTVAGTKAFKTVTSAVQAAWVAGGTADTVVVGFGALVGFPASLFTQQAPITAASQMLVATLGGAVVTSPAFTFDADEIEKNTVDGSASTYNGTKKLVVLTYR